MKSVFATLEIEPFLFANAQDQALLKTHHLKLSRKFHPDRFIGKSQEELQASEARSAEINQALRELTDPWNRSEVVLKSLGRDLNSNKEAKIPDLAMEYFQVQEDITDNPKQAEQIRSEFLKKLSVHSNECDRELENITKPYPFTLESKAQKSWPPGPNELQRLLELCQRRNYIKRMIQNLNPAADKGLL